MGHNPLPVVAVLMGYQNPAEVLWALAQLGHTLNCVLYGKATVHHQAGIAPFHQRRVTSAATTQGCKPHNYSGLRHIQTQYFQQPQ